MRAGKRCLTIVLAAAAMAALATSDAGATRPEVYVKPASAFSEGWAYALDGYDPTSYFTESGPQRGSDLYTWEWKGARWRFASRNSMDKFIEQPEAFSPQYGGYCAWAVAYGRTEPGDPRVWAIHNGKLYLNMNRAIKRKWDKDRDALIARADANWPGVLEK